MTSTNAEKPATDASVNGLQGTDHAGELISSPIAEQSPKTQDAKRVSRAVASPTARDDISSPESVRKVWLRASAPIGSIAASSRTSGSSHSTTKQSSGACAHRWRLPRGHGHDRGAFWIPSKKGRGMAQASLDLIEAMYDGGGGRAADHRSRRRLQAVHQRA